MAESQTTAAQEVPEALFFNVMPKARLRSDLVLGMTKDAASIAPGGNFSGSVTAAKSKFSSKAALAIVLIFLFVAGLGVGGYYAYKWRKSRQNAGAALLNPVQLQAPPVAPPPIAPPPSEALPPPSPFETTTPGVWQKRHFGDEVCTLESCSDIADPDNDGLINRDEFASQTDPKDPDTDNDGISDGDETNVFGTKPLTGRTAGDPEYTDSDYLKGRYDPRTKGSKMSPERQAEIRELVKKFGLHEPTPTTLRLVLSTYQEGAIDQLIDNSPTAQLDRDAQRLATVKKIGVALYAYSQDAGYYPVTDSFEEMVAKIKPYNPIATNFSDPINQAPYVYAYEASGGGKDFVLTYYSETQKQTIRYTGANASKDTLTEQANANDDRRVRDLETLRSALLIYSAAKSDGATGSIFPAVDDYKTELVPEFLEEIPKDPKTSADYEYMVSKDFKEFTVKAKLENPPAGSSGFLCTQDECDTY